jgi:molybdopterin adenylyltransferase
MPVKIHAVVITVSDGCAHGHREDRSGAALFELLEGMGAEVLAREVVPDDPEPLAEMLRAYAERPDVNLIITTGGTGFAPRDNTPEATRAVIEREAPGLSEAMRIETRSNTPMAMISRGVCGTRSGTLIVNLPGSPKAVSESFGVIRPVLPHVIALLGGQTEHDA